MLIIVEDRNVALFLQFPLNLEAARRRDVLKVDAAEGTGDVVDRLDEFIHILRLHAQREGIHIAKGLEQHALSFHDRHARFRSDIAQSQNSRAIRDDRAHIVTSCQFIRLQRILLDLQAGLSDARCISQ